VATRACEARVVDSVGVRVSLRAERHPQAAVSAVRHRFDKPLHNDIVQNLGSNRVRPETARKYFFQLFREWDLRGGI